MSETSLPYAIEALRAVGPTIVAIIAAGIAGLFGYRQWRTAHDKVVLDLFDRRSSVFVDVYDGIGAVLAYTEDGEIRSAFRKFHEAREKARFLFGPEVLQWIEEAVQVAIKYRALHLSATRNIPDATRVNLAEEAASLSADLERRLKSFHTVMHPYLALQHRA
jgi:hypothetical protein